ncbi:hypothetical protein BJV74DRAFT_768571 [Russula compacta]|nr:hypothetical protein BJV74DRAFT_768571 [Russula compacta]
MAGQISKNPSNHGAMLVGVVAGRNKTVASVAMGQQEFNPIYMGLGDRVIQSCHLLAAYYVTYFITSLKRKTRRGISGIRSFVSNYSYWPIYCFAFCLPLIQNPNST